ncbi:virulence factor family protein [Xanthomonas rydalmerensis]|uniref:Virulence factor family protein n=2 Tax=Xanthomonas rydalmerensis TaxID=3046274 RepID=A0ABZ0JJP5_9XANT|nr:MULTISPECIES: virulence factor family protein [unclassified Xanthomonas]MBB5877973.1 type IV secretory pathway VirJ component [Xanthomonas sp. 3498]WOS39643.1 virulence factor family protein [Xanthomonas sp. DM-2023]WOS43827.1 virulence factor family protein [Xanthomonas sp. DM-2023]WOS48007.1 virulence factor family protein [Xanthomonas sp. DM-2023]WOS52186.1 virulence factor family protein [Xanthomonas sp. DM-2023]
MMQKRGGWMWGCALGGLLAAGVAGAAPGAAAAAAPRAGAPAAAPEKLSHGRFEQVPVLLPKGNAQRVVLWFAGGKHADAERTRQIEALRDDGAMVAVIDSAHLQAVLAKIDGTCGFSAGDVENFSRYVQAYFHVPTYHLPLLVGDGDGAALAYAVAAQAPKHLLAGLLTEDFCPVQVLDDQICGAGITAPARALKPTALPVPWLAALDAKSRRDRCTQQSDAFVQKVAQARQFRRSASGDALPGLRAAVRSLGDRPGVSLPPTPADLAGLPVVDVPAAAGAGDADNGNVFAIFVSGDGGWAGLDQQVAGALAKAGIPVVGVDSLRYFWSERTPQGFATDLDRIYRHYSHLWQRGRVVLIGFSQGADVLPAAYNQLPEAMRDQVQLTALLSVGKTADYEFHVSNWISSGDDGLPIAPEVAKMPPAQTLCIYGEDDDDALCPDLPKGGPQLVKLPGDHHFQGDYATLAKQILQRIQ